MIPLSGGSQIHRDRVGWWRPGMEEVLEMEGGDGHTTVWIINTTE